MSSKNKTKQLSMQKFIEMHIKEAKVADDGVYVDVATKTLFDECNYLIEQIGMEDVLVPRMNTLN